MANLCMPHPHSLEPMYTGHPYIYPNVPLSPMSLEMYRSLHYIRSNFPSFSPDAALFHPQPIRNFHSFALTQPVHAPQPFATLPKSFYGQNMRRCNAQNTMEKSHPRKKSLKRNRTNSGSSEENEKSEVRTRVSFSVDSLSKSDSKFGPEDELRPNRNNVTPPPKRTLWNPFFSPLRESSDNDSPDSHSSFSDESEGSEPRPKTHVCEQCQRSFTRKSNLERHRRLHSGEKLFVCKDCGAKFSQVANLNYHVRTHTQEKPYHCDHCSRSFRGSSHLKRHIRIHTGERPYKCEICNLAFLSWDQKKRHLKLVHQ